MADRNGFENAALWWMLIVVTEYTMCGVSMYSDDVSRNKVTHTLHSHSTYTIAHKQTRALRKQYGIRSKAS